MKIRKTSATAKSKYVITRVFNATPEQVFKAWTKPSELKKWWGPQGFSAPFIKSDLKKGGKYLYAMKGPDGKLYWSGGVFKKIEPPHKLVITDYFADENGNKVSPTVHGLDKNFPKESTAIITFEKEKLKTRLSIIYVLPKSLAAKNAIKKSLMADGWNSSLDKFEKLFKQ